MVLTACQIYAARGPCLLSETWWVICLNKVTCDLCEMYPSDHMLCHWWNPTLWDYGMPAEDNNNLTREPRWIFWCDSAPCHYVIHQSSAWAHYCLNIIFFLLKSLQQQHLFTKFKIAYWDCLHPLFTLRIETKTTYCFVINIKPGQDVIGNKGRVIRAITLQHD